MAFHLADVKKTVRSRSDGERYVHPKVLDGPSISAQVGLALAYFNARLGRVRHEFEAEMLVRFFGDAKVARGLVACLGATYRWRSREFADVLAPGEVARLAARGLYTPCDLRLFLYDRLNGTAEGFLDAPREDHLADLAKHLRLDPAKLDQLVALDSEENAVLVRIGPVPLPETMVALYNYHSASAMLRNSVWVEFPVLSAAARQALDMACRDQGVTLTHEGERTRLENRPDMFGSYARAGARLLRALLQAAATCPEVVRSGQAKVALGGQAAALYLLERSTAQTLTGRTGVVRVAADLPCLREEWARYRASAGTGGWRLVASPEPILSSSGLALAPYACRRDDVEVLLWPAATASGMADARALVEAGLQILPVATGGLDEATETTVKAARQATPAAVVAALDEGWAARRSRPAAQALEGLLHDVERRGFVPDAEALAALGCATLDELGLRLRAVDPSQAAYVPGLGLCSPAFAAEMRKGLRRKPRRRSAA